MAHTVLCEGSVDQLHFVDSSYSGKYLPSLLRRGYYSWYLVVNLDDTDYKWTAEREGEGEREGD